MSNQQNDAKRAAARRVIQDFVFDGMTLGLVPGPPRISLCANWASMLPRACS